MTRRTLALAFIFVSLPAVASAAESCPKTVIDAVAKAYDGAKLEGCKATHENGKLVYGVHIGRSDGKRLELDVAPDGAILVVEEKVAFETVPEVVRKAFAARYPRARVKGAEMQTHAGGKVDYEIAFVDGANKEATFAADGTFIDEE